MNSFKLTVGQENGNKETIAKFESDSYCVGERNRSATTKIYGNITSKDKKVLIAYCSICNRKKSVTVSDNTITAERLGCFHIVKVM